MLGTRQNFSALIVEMILPPNDHAARELGLLDVFIYHINWWSFTLKQKVCPNLHMPRLAA